jgi:magnesium-protoporphyrin IX monomethyl ester (oxidative) cyclase
MRYLFLINPPERKGYSNERTYSGGLGVARKLKWREKPDLYLPPPDMMLTAAIAEQCGLTVEVVDLLLDRHAGEAAVRYSLERMRHKAAASDEVWIGVRLSMPTLTADLDFANRLKEEFPASRLFLFGSVIMTTLDYWAARTDADAVLYGEPEALVGAMFQAHGEAWRNLPGVLDPRAFVPLEGEALYDGSMQARFHDWALVKNLAELPFPAYHLLPIERYSPSGRIEECGVFVTASRGCPIGCTMCPYMLHEGRNLRVSAADRVVDEMEWLNKTWGIHRWRFRDPNFGFNRKLVREILTQVIERGVRMEATVEVSLEVVEDSLIELMAEAGVKTITTGIESADEGCLASIGQKIKVNEILARKIAYADSLGIHVYGTFVVGSPEESWETVARTIAFSKTVPCECGFTVMTPFPGTPLYYRYLEEGLLRKEMVYERWNSYEATSRSRFLTTDDLMLARLWARLELIIPYRLRKAREAGGAGLLRAHIKLLPYQIALRVVRAKVAYRRRRESPPVSVPATIAGRPIEKIPLAPR